MKSKKVLKKTFQIGIQGGPGSFNEEALRAYVKLHGITDYKIKYLYTTRKVLDTLHKGKIDRGLFAIQNSIGGMVKESINALSEFNCKIIDEVSIPVNHTLLIRRGVPVSKIKTIMSHPQALVQCMKTLQRKYPDQLKISGDGNLVDQATAAKALAQGKLADSVAVIASKVCADLYSSLEMIDTGLQDNKQNVTTFLFVSRFLS
jgi:prephenate dehydratase